MIMFRPLEEIMNELLEDTRIQDKERFQSDTERFYKAMGVLEKYNVIGTHTGDLMKRYQQRYNQIKMLIRG